MWSFTEVDCSFRLWFSDGKPIKAARGGHGVSSRLIVDQQGFLDLTEIPLSKKPMIDANGSTLWLPPDLERTIHSNNNTSPLMMLSLEIKVDSFRLSLVPFDNTGTGIYSTIPSVSGRLKPLPRVSAADANFIERMVDQKYVPYPNIPDASGKTVEEIKELGQRLFPFSPHSCQLAMCVYDWTTASFTRMVLLKIFQYTGLPPPFPIDQNSIASQIWASNWGSYTPQDADFMHSFMMKPADSLDDVKTQLSDVATALQEFSDVENRLLSAAMQALPRTSIFQHPQLFSGQVDIYQLGLEHFGIEFLECPLNNGPAGEELITTFADVIATYVSVGKTITTKMVWSFTDNVKDAVHYSNGILLVVNIPGDSIVWERTAYVTPLSDDPKKTEYTFMPETQFEVQSVESATVDDKSVVVITLQPKPSKEQAFATPEHLDVLSLVKTYTPALDLPHSPNKTGGRRCACVTRTMSSSSTSIE